METRKHIKLTSTTKFAEILTSQSFRTQFDEEKKVVPHLTEDRFSLKSFIDAYAEILLRWSLFEKRSEVLKFLKKDESSQLTSKICSSQILLF